MRLPYYGDAFEKLRFSIESFRNNSVNILFETPSYSVPKRYYRIRHAKFYMRMEEKSKSERISFHAIQFFKYLNFYLLTCSCHFYKVRQ